jgi:hypothetical protein
LAARSKVRASSAQYPCQLSKCDTSRSGFLRITLLQLNAICFDKRQLQGLLSGANLCRLPSGGK